MEEHTTWNIFAHLARNIGLGALASFLVWAFATPDATFSATNVTVREVAFGIIFGGGGGTIVNNFFRQAQKIEAFSKAIDEANKVFDKLK